MALSYALPARPERAPARVPEPRRELAELGELLAGHFLRREPREAAEGYLRALLDQTGASNSWRLAARAGDNSPWRMQRLLTRARWDEEALRASVAEWLTGHLGHRAAILRLGQDHTPKKGTRTVAVARQYRDETGRVENCQAIVLLSYLSPRGCALLDRELYLPREWCASPARCRGAGVPQERLSHRTPGRLARTVVERARDARVPFSWVSGSVAYGLDEELRGWLEQSGVGYVLAVPREQFEREAAP
ncbi:MAG TPA: transposase, partial [Streptomyces sp.]|nr:transposase [Streptomyces sp.]